MSGRGRHRVPNDRALQRLGRFVARHRRLVVVTWAVVVALSFGFAVGGLGGETLFERLHTGEPSVPGEAQEGRDLLSANDASGGVVLVQVDGAPVTDPEVATATAEMTRQLSALPGVASVVSPFVVPGGPTSPAAAPMLAGGTTTSGGFLVTVNRAVDAEVEALDLSEQVAEVAPEAMAGVEGATVRVGSNPLLVQSINDQVETDLRIGEGVALPVSLLVMVLVFGGFIAAAMPIIGAVASIGGGLASLLVFSHLIELDATVVNIVTVLGLGLCIDYGLLIVSRFREELREIARGSPAAEITDEQVQLAAARTVGAAGRTVLISGVTVGISLAGLLVFADALVRSIGAAGASVVAVAVTVALTLVPALCTMGARRLVRKGTDVAANQGAFSRLARRVQRRPVVVLVATLAVLVVAALPSLQLRTTSSGVELLPVGAEQRVFFEDLARDYPATSAPAVTVVGRTTPAEMQTWADQATGLPGVASVDPVRELADGYASVGLRTATGPMDDEARNLVTEIRADRPPFENWVTGQAAALADYNELVRERAPYAIALVGLATMFLLFLMTGSIVIPAKALIANVISLGASIGLIVFIFQWGHFENLLNFQSVGAIEVFIPLLLLAFGFGLSMDYEVFLLSRIVELRKHGHSDNDAVAYGLQRSGRIITSAALLIVIVFSGFVFGQLLIIKETGVALAASVAIDATLVRMLLVPSTMTLLGRWNWWAPAPLARWHERHGIQH